MEHEEPKVVLPQSNRLRLTDGKQLNEDYRLVLD